MKIVFVVYHDLKIEARSQELFNMMKMLGETTVVSFSDYFSGHKENFVFNSDNKKNIVEFLVNAKKTIKEQKPDIVLLHDNFTAPLIRYVRKILPSTIILYDSSELRLLEEKKKKSFKSRVADLFKYAEKKHINLCDVVIAANQERAQIMCEKFSLSKQPLVFDNIHKIEGEYSLSDCQKKYGDYFKDEAFYALYAGGVSEKRLSYKMAQEIGKLGSGYKLLIVGSKEKNAENKLKDLFEKNNISNVNYLGFVSREELKYLMDKVHVTISAFALDTYNNIYCASGKVYEGFFQGKPILAGINPPLKNLCEEYGVGVSTDNFGTGLKTIEANYNMYVKNVNEYVNQLNYNSRLTDFAHTIQDEIDRVKGIK